MAIPNQLNHSSTDSVRASVSSRQARHGRKKNYHSRTLEKPLEVKQAVASIAESLFLDASKELKSLQAPPSSPVMLPTIFEEQDKSLLLATQLFKTPGPELEINAKALTQLSISPKSLVTASFIEFPEDRLFMKLASCIPLMGFFIGFKAERSLLGKIAILQDRKTQDLALSIKNNYKYTSIARALFTSALVIQKVFSACIAASMLTFATYGLIGLATLMIAKKIGEIVSNRNLLKSDTPLINPLSIK